jgi:hypothetical protein
MALMEYCLVNIILGDSDAPKPPTAEAPKPEKVFDLAAKVSRLDRLFSLTWAAARLRLRDFLFS